MPFADEYELLLNYFPNLEVEPVSREILLAGAVLHARHRIRTPDAILMATGVRHAVTAAVTNDTGWKAVRAAGMETILLSELSA